MWSIPKKPHLNPKPSATEDSGSKVREASFSFFLISNLGVWFLSYPLNLKGLTTCFVLALPFFVNSLSGDLFYSLVLDLSIKKIKQPKSILIRSHQSFSQ